MTRASHPSYDAASPQRYRQAEDFADNVQRHAGPWMERYARLGYAAKGALYLLVGVLALQAAIGWGGQIGDSRSALATLEGKWGIGTVLLWVIGFGLAGYALWNLFRAALDPENEGNDAKGIGKRVFFAISGTVHAMLAVWVFSYLLGSASSSGEGGTRDRVAQLLEWGVPGQLLIAAIALGIIGYGIYQFSKAYRAKLSDELELSGLSPRARKFTIWTARFGLAARGMIFVLVGWFLLQAAWYSTSGEAGGLGKALHRIGQFGWIVLAVVSAGLAAYGVFMFIKARYRRIDVH